MRVRLVDRTQPGANIGQVRRYGPDGTVRWEREVTSCCGGNGIGNVELKSLAADPGGLTVGGWAQGSTTGGHDTVERGWIRRISPSGATLWTRELKGSVGAAVTQTITTNEVGIFATGSSQGPIPGLPTSPRATRRGSAKIPFDGSVASTSEGAADGSIPACDALVAHASTQSLPWGSPGGVLASVGPGNALGWTFERPGTESTFSLFQDVALRTGHAYAVEEGGALGDGSTRILALDGIPAAPGCDTSPPVAGTPRTAFPVGSTTGATIPVDIGWTATDAGSGVARFELRLRVNGAAPTLVDDGVTTRSRRVALVPGKDYRFGVRAFDRAGNADASWGPITGLRRIDDRSASIRYSSGWRSGQSATAIGGTLGYVSASGATAESRSPRGR